MTALSPPGAAGPAPGAAARGIDSSGPFGPTLALAVTLAAAIMLSLIAALMLVVHPQVGGLGVFAVLVNQQNQNAKTGLYVVAFAVVLPFSLILARRCARVISASPNAPGLPVLAASLAGSLAAALILIRLSHALPWGDGLGTVLGGALIWSAGATAALRRASRPRPWPALARHAPRSTEIAIGAGALLFGAVLCVSPVRSLSAPATTLAALAGLAAVWGVGRGSRLTRRPAEASPGSPERPTRDTRRLWVAVDVAFVVLLLLAIPDLSVFHTSAGPPNIFSEPGIVQYQQDFLLGPANQLLGGGSLLVNDPVSQYGVGSIFFMAGWFHLVPIGYGMFGLLDSLLTALFFIAGYCVLRVAGVTRLLACSALAIAVVAFVYNLYYAVGQLPEQGPLRFGPPIAVILATVIANRTPRYARAARAASLCALGVAAIWAVEAFGYTVFTFLALAAVEAWLLPAGRRRWLLHQLARGMAACVIAHGLLAAAILIGTGQLPHWSQYLEYVRALLLGGRAGSITYGFARWSPGLAIGLADLTSAGALALLVLRAPEFARRERTTLIALGGCSAYAIALFSYTDNRSSTYLLPYVSLPILLAAVLWLSLLLRSRRETSLLMRRAGVACACAVAVLMLGAAWPSADHRFSDSALAHAYPGGGLAGGLRALAHPPPIDPRAPAGERLLARYMPARRALILLPTVPDLGTEILIRTRRANSLFIGDPKADSLVPAVWKSRLTRAIALIAPGTRLLTDRIGMAMVARFARDPGLDPLKHELEGGSQEPEWILRQLQQRFRLVPIHTDPDGLIVAKLVARRR